MGCVAKAASQQIEVRISVNFPIKLHGAASPITVLLPCGSWQTAMAGRQQLQLQSASQGRQAGAVTQASQP